MERLRLIPRIVVWLVEFAVAFIGIGGIISGFVMFFFSGDPDVFFNGFLFIPLFLVFFYIASVVTIFVCYLLNFLTSFDDFFDFGEMIESLSLAPLYLIRNVFVHFGGILKLLFTGEVD